MQKYVTQLLEDLENAKLHEPPSYNVKIMHPDEPALDYGLTGVAEFLHSPMYVMEDIFEIKTEWYPPIEKLTEEEVKSLVQKTIELWSAFNFYPSFPSDLPTHIQYTMLVNRMKEESQYVSDGFIGIEFCHYDVEECPFGPDYCQCKEL